MHQVKFKASGDVFELIGFVNNKIIIRFNNGQSVGTVPKTGYIPLIKVGGWDALELLFKGEDLKKKIKENKNA